MSENFGNQESVSRIEFIADGEKCVLEERAADEGIAFAIVAGATREIDEKPGYEVLVVRNFENVAVLDKENDLVDIGLGSQKIEKGGVVVDLIEERIIGPDAETVERVIKELDFAYVNEYEV